jgi:predicted molibdopterin-dependent oxidoreductase YjgC
MIQISINGADYEVAAGNRLIDAINGARVPLPQVCYHPQLGPIQTCDTCIVEVNGETGSCLCIVGRARHEGLHERRGGKCRSNRGV